MPAGSAGKGNSVRIADSFGKPVPKLRPQL
jgi:hypothetical protein